MNNEPLITERGRIRWASHLPALLTLALLVLAEPAFAGVLEIQAQSQYDFVQVKRRGEKATGNGRFFLNYGLSLRRPFLPTSSLMTDLRFNATESGDPYSSQTNRGWLLNLYSNDPKYTVSGRMGRNNYSYSSDLLSSSTGTTTDYNLNMFLRQPAWPVLNLQFQRNLSESGFAGVQTGQYATTSWLMGTSYDLRPLRFSYDRIRQTYGYAGAPGFGMNRQTAAVSINHALMPGLLLSGELSRSTSDVSRSGSPTSTGTNRRIVRLTATPMSSVVADVALTSLTTDQTAGTRTGKFKDNSVSWSVRSQVLPGLSVDLEDQSQVQTGNEFYGFRDSKTRNRGLSVAARLSEDAVLSASKTNTTYDIDSVDFNAKQDSLQSALQTNLTRTTDMSLNYGKTRSVTGSDNVYNSTYQSISFRDRTSPKLSVGVTYRRLKVRSENGEFEDFRQSGDSVDLDLLTQPNPALSVSLRLSYQDNRESGAFRALAPSANVRWQITPATNLTANYSEQRIDQVDPINSLIYGHDTKGISVRMTHYFTNGSSLDLGYGFQGSSIGDLEWRRLVRVGYTMALR